MRRRARIAVLGLLLLVVPAAAGGAEGWEATLARAARSVVALHVSAPRPFDTEGAAVLLATGFVVDAEQGLILTNRHVVHPGPVVAEAVFLNHERVPVWPVYRDPVHDFGFFRFDPDAVRFMEPVALPLAPEAARVGTDIRVLGNDAGEKLSILAGTLARLDRAAPEYGRGRYNDFNTFYYQAASSSSGGSSGSPVIDRQGRAIALNAGGSRRSAASFFLPLPRVVRALEAIREGRPVTRGTLQTELRYEPYDELRRLGLDPEREAHARRVFPDSVGLLVVHQVLRGGPADGLLEPGDVLLRVDGRDVADFVSVEAVLDARVGQSVRLDVERGGRPLSLEVPVGDLHALAPDHYLEMGGGIFHDLSYQMARSFGVPVRGVFVAWPGYALARGDVPGRVVISDLDGEPTPDLESFRAHLAERGDGERVRVRCRHLTNPFVPETGSFEVDRRWFPMRSCRRDDPAGRFDCAVLPDPPPAPPPAPATTALEAAGPGPTERLARSLVMVEFDVPLPVDGVQGTAFAGTGLVVDAQRGLVVVDRDTVPIALGDVRLTFGGAVRVPARLVALHPEHDLAVVRYDPALLGSTPVASAELREGPLEAGEEVWRVTLGRGHQVHARRTSVASVEPARVPLPAMPRFRETNVELAFLDDVEDGVGGVLADARGRVRALFASFSVDENGRPDAFFGGLPVALVRDFVAPLREGRPPAWRSLGVEWRALSLAEARARGLPEAEARVLEAHDPLRRRALSVERVVAGGPADGLLQPGDLLVAADGRVVTAFREVEAASAGGAPQLTVVRDGARREVTVTAEPLAGRGTRRVVMFAGALLQATPRAVSAQRGIRPGGVYVASSFAGTPAARDGLAPTLRIEAVDDLPTPDLDTFLAAVAGRADRSALRLRTRDLEGQVRAQTLQLDLLYWPTVRWSVDEDGAWHRHDPEEALPRPRADEAPPPSAPSRVAGGEDAAAPAAGSPGPAPGP